MITGSTSVWMDEGLTPQASPLHENLNAQVAIVGAGIAGLSIAYHLVQQGKTVVVMDDGEIGMGETARTTAHLSNAIDDRYSEMERIHGREACKRIAASHTTAIDRIEQIILDEQIDCEFRRLDGYLFLSSEGVRDELERELKAAHHAGLTQVDLLERVPLEFFDFGPCLRFPRQAQFDPLKYLRALTKAIEKQGGRIFNKTHVTQISGDEHCALLVTQDARTVRADNVVVATNSPINDRVVMHTKQAPYRTYAVGLEVPGGSIQPALYWDTSSTSPGESPSYHYIRLQHGLEHAGNGSPATLSKSDLLIVGGEDHKTGQAHDAEARWDRLERWARHRFPMAKEVRYRWSGQVMEPVDGLAFIGRNPGGPENVYIVTGDSGMGMTHGTIAGMLISDLILGRSNPWESIYDPSRKTLGSVWDFAKESVNVAAQYLDWLKASDVQSEAQITPGQGAVLRHGLTLVAVYRDEDGRLHERSAVCPHLGCIVSFNEVEKTWDCPCHGSRFDCHGQVINGPANSDLAPMRADKREEVRQ